MVKQLKSDPMGFREDEEIQKLIDPKNKPVYEKPIQICVKRNKTICSYILKTDTIDTLLDKIAKRMEVKKDFISLEYNGKFLQQWKGEQIREFNIHKGSTLNMCTRTGGS